MKHHLFNRVSGLALLLVMFGGLATNYEAVVFINTLNSKRGTSAVQSYSLSALPIDAPPAAVANAVKVTKNMLTGSTLVEPVASRGQPVLPPRSLDLCTELLKVSKDHYKVQELLTRAQMPSASEGGALPIGQASRSRVTCATGALDKSKKIVDAFLFGGGEVDTLEIRLFELYPVVDRFLIIVSNVTHKGERAFNPIQHIFESERFRVYQDKVDVFEHQQALGNADVDSTRFVFEADKEKAVHEYVQHYDNQTLVIFGHVDEIPARDDVSKLAKCQVVLPGNFGIWFPYGNLRMAFRSDFPARGRPWTLGDPGVFEAKNMRGLARGTHANVLGYGFHATNYCFPPQVLLKSLTATEYKGFASQMARMKVAMDNDARTGCEHFMRDIRSKCLLGFGRSSRYRKVEELVVQMRQSRAQFYVPLALREQPAQSYSRYPCWDPEGAAKDWRMNSIEKMDSR
jgi:beta-1,4-mannosyl-glycoprotein beta-1,4-N-acetylglucosaminyltransferase